MADGIGAVSAGITETLVQWVLAVIVIVLGWVAFLFIKNFRKGHDGSGRDPN